MKKFAFVVMLCLAAASLYAEDFPSLIQSKSSPLVLKKNPAGDALEAQFTGQVIVSGTLIAKWWPGAVNIKDDEPDYQLVPDQRSRSKLPHFSGYAVQSIGILNGPEALRKASGAAIAARLATHEIESVRVKGSFLIGSYQVGVECDAPWAVANILRAQRIQSIRIFKPRPDGGC